MNRKDLVRKFAAKGYTQRDGAAIIDDVIDLITDALVNGETIFLRGFGTFTLKRHKERDIINVSTGKKEHKEAFYKPTFVPSEMLKARCNNENVSVESEEDEEE
jgi:nucleoid DNA-binding protein